MKEIVSSTATVFVIKIIGAALGFLFTVVVARELGTEGAGVFFLALSVMTIASVIGRLGLDSSLLRYAAERTTVGDWGGVRNVHVNAMSLALLGSVATTVVLLTSSGWLAHVLFKKDYLAEPLRWISIAIIPFALLNLQAEGLKGVKYYRAAIFVQTVGLSAISLVILALYSGEKGIFVVIGAYCIAAIMTMLGGLLAWHRAVGLGVGTRGAVSVRTLWASSSNLFIVSIINKAILPWAPLVLLGVWADSAEVGVFGAATRIAALVSFLLTAVNAIVAPKFAELHAQGDVEALGSVARRTALVITILASPLLLPMIVGGSFVLSIFGEEFSTGGSVLTVLAGGQFINTYCGSVGYLLMMTGHEQSYRNANVVAAVIQVLLTLALVPVLGALGAAVSSTIGLVAVNILSVYLAWKHLGIRATVVPRYLREGSHHGS